MSKINTSLEERHKALLKGLFQTAVEAVSASGTLPPMLPDAPPTGRTLVLGAGKAAAAMAQVAWCHLRGPVSGLVVTREGHGADMDAGAIEILEAAHPVPDGRSVHAAQAMLALAAQLRPQDRLVFLASGGGSAVLALPLPGLDLSQKQDIVRHLVLCGAPISAINGVRKQLSAIKGGRLAAASGSGDIRSFIISDVPGDHPADVASGPTLADDGTADQALRIMARYGVPHLPAVQKLLHAMPFPAMKRKGAGAKPVIIARALDALQAAAFSARRQGWQVHILGDALEGEARELGEDHAHLARELKAKGGRHVLLSGGEATVAMHRQVGLVGQGGPNQEYLAALAGALDGENGISALACDTDGIDGNGDAAGALVFPSTLARAAASGVNAQAALAGHNCGAFFKALGDLVATGPTRTNVNDFRAIVVEAGPGAGG